MTVTPTWWGGRCTVDSLWVSPQDRGWSRKASAPDSSFSSCDTIYKRFPQVSFPSRTRSFENTQPFLTTKVSGSVLFYLFKPLPRWKKAGIYRDQIYQADTENSVWSSDARGTQPSPDASCHSWQSPTDPHLSSVREHFSLQQRLGMRGRAWRWNGFPHRASVLETLVHVRVADFAL